MGHLDLGDGAIQIDLSGFGRSRHLAQCFGLVFCIMWCALRVKSGIHSG